MQSGYVTILWLPPAHLPSTLHTTIHNGRLCIHSRSSRKGTLRRDRQTDQGRLGAFQTRMQDLTPRYTPLYVFRYDSLTLVITGSGESGKSTIVKQMKIIHKEGFTDAELAEYRPIVFKNVLDSAQAVIIYMRKIGWDFVGYSNRVRFLFLLFPTFRLKFIL